MARSTTLAVKIISDSRDASQGFKEAESRVAGFQQGLERASQGAQRLLLGVGALAVGAFNEASKLQQSTGAVEAVFDRQAKAVKKSAEAAAQANGLSRNDYQELAAVIGSQLKNMGIAHDQLLPKTRSLINLGSDLAAVYGGPVSDAVDAVSSLMRGETDPIERYGVSIKQSDINARLAAEGHSKLTGAAAKAAQAQAVLGLLTDQTSQVQGQFAAQSGTAAEQLQIAKAEMANAAAELGESLLPIVADGSGKLAEFAGWIKENKDWVVPLVAVLGLLAAATWAVNFAMAANPFVLIMLAIGAVIAVVVVMYNKFGWFRDLMQAIGGFLGHVLDGLMSAIKWVIDKFQFIGTAAKWVGGLFSAAPAAGGGGGGGASLSYGGGGAGGAAFRGGSMGGLGLGGGSAPVALQAPASTIINVTVNGAIDPVGTGRAVVDALREYAAATGTQVAVTVGAGR